MKTAKSLIYGGELIDAIDCAYEDFKRLAPLCPNCSSPVHLKAGGDRLSTKGKPYKIPQHWAHFAGKSVEEVAACELRVNNYSEAEREKIHRVARGQREKWIRRWFWTAWQKYSSAYCMAKRFYLMPLVPNPKDISAQLLESVAAHLNRLISDTSTGDLKSKYLSEIFSFLLSRTGKDVFIEILSVYEAWEFCSDLSVEQPYFHDKMAWFDNGFERLGGCLVSHLFDDLRRIDWASVFLSKNEEELDSSPSNRIKAAKVKQLRWLQSAAADVEKKEGFWNEYVSIGDHRYAGSYHWRINREGPGFGVWCDYPLMPGDNNQRGCLDVWDERGVYGGYGETGIENIYDNPGSFSLQRLANTMGDFEYTKNGSVFISGYPNDAVEVVDIAVQHKGLIHFTEMIYSGRLYDRRMRTQGLDDCFPSFLGADLILEKGALSFDLKKEEWIGNVWLNGTVGKTFVGDAHSLLEMLIPIVDFSKDISDEASEGKRFFADNYENLLEWLLGCAQRYGVAQYGDRSYGISIRTEGGATLSTLEKTLSYLDGTCSCLVPLIRHRAIDSTPKASPIEESKGVQQHADRQERIRGLRFNIENTLVAQLSMEDAPIDEDGWLTMGYTPDEPDLAEVMPLAVELYAQSNPNDKIEYMGWDGTGFSFRIKFCKSWLNTCIGMIHPRNISLLGLSSHLNPIAL